MTREWHVAPWGDDNADGLTVETAVTGAAAVPGGSGTVYLYRGTREEPRFTGMCPKSTFDAIVEKLALLDKGELANEADRARRLIWDHGTYSGGVPVATKAPSGNRNGGRS